MTTAQDDFRAMLRDVLSPALRREGFKGSRVKYVVRDAAWALVGFQRSTATNASAVKFTVNLESAGEGSYIAVCKWLGTRKLAAISPDCD
jgi:hypothetical protein